MRIASLVVLCLLLVAVPAVAQTYDNGPINGSTDAWTINFGYIVSDTFTAPSPSISAFSFGVWEFGGDSMTSVDWSITASENGGQVYGSGTASGKNLTDTFISSNQYGYDIDLITVTGLNVNGLTTDKRYWLTLQNALVPSGNLVFWDENSGIDCESSGCPSLASEGALGTLPSEAFTIGGGCGAGNNSPCGTTPEPSSIMLFGSGILGLVGVLRRKLF